MDTPNMNEIMLVTAIVVSISVRIAVAKDHVPRSMGHLSRLLVTWGDATFIVLPIALLLGPTQGILALLPFVLIALVVLATLQVRELNSDQTGMAAHAPLKVCSSIAAHEVVTGSGTRVVPFHMRKRVPNDAPGANS